MYLSIEGNSGFIMMGREKVFYYYVKIENFFLIGWDKSYVVNFCVDRIILVFFDGNVKFFG